MSVARRVSEPSAAISRMPPSEGRVPRRGDGAADELQRAGEGVTGNGKLHRGSLIFLLGSDVSDSWMVGDSGRVSRSCRREVRVWITSPRAGGSCPVSVDGSRPAALRPQARVDPVDGLGGLRAGLEPSRRPRGSRAGRWCGRGRSRARSRLSESGVSSRARYIASWRARATRGDRRGESSSSRVSPLTAQTASWIAVSDGGSAVGTGSPARRPERAVDDRRRQRLAEQRGDRHHPGHRALEHADVVGHAGGDLLEHARVRAARAASVGGEPPEHARSGSAGRAARARPAGPS